MTMLFSLDGRTQDWELLPDLKGEMRPWREPVVHMQIDMKRAHFYGKAQREIYVELPEEYGAPLGKVGLHANGNV